MKCWYEEAAARARNARPCGHMRIWQIVFTRNKYLHPATLINSPKRHFAI
jgi:hypothetical protein